MPKGLQQHGLAVNLGDVRVSFGVAGNADAFDAMGLEQAGFKQLQSGVIFANRRWRAATKHQHFGDFGLPGQGCDAGLEVIDIADEARRHMGHRLKSRLTQFGCGVKLGGDIGGVDQGDEHLRAGPQIGLQHAELLDLFAGDFY